MPTINFSQLLSDCINATKPIAGAAWNDLKPYAEHEFQKFAESAEFLVKLRLNNNIDDEELNARLDIQKTALQSVLLTIHGIALITAQNIINAIIGIISTAFQSTLGLTLPI